MAELIRDTIDLSAYMSETHDGENIRPASKWVDEVISKFHGVKRNEGALLPWTKTHDTIRLRPHEVSMWHGANYSGKSTVTAHVALDLCAQGYKVCMASMEMRPPDTIAKLARQASGMNRPEIQFIKDFHRWTDGKLWIYDRYGMVEPKRMVALVKYAADKLGIQHFFIDSLMKCVRKEDDYNQQKDFLTDLCDAALQYPVHVHLVHHSRKPDDEGKIPSRYDAKGSGSISDQIDNSFGVARNKKKDDAKKAGADYDHDKPDVYVNVDKQRHGEWDGIVGLWFDPASFQYRGDRLALRREYSLREPGADEAEIAA